MLWILTGAVNSGKSSWAAALNDTLRHNLGLSIGGMINHPGFSDNDKTGYVCESLLTGERIEFARKGSEKQNPDDIVCGRWVISGEALSFACRTLEETLNSDVDLVIVDEFGILEMNGTGLRREIDRLVDASCNVLLIVRERLVEEVFSLYSEHHPVILDIQTLDCNKDAILASGVYKWFDAHHYIQ